MKPKAGEEVYSTLSLTYGARWGPVVKATPRPLYSWIETRYPLYRGLGGPQGPSERVRKFSFPTQSDHRTVQLVASCYTDYANLAEIHSTGDRLKSQLSYCLRQAF